MRILSMEKEIQSPKRPVYGDRDVIEHVETADEALSILRHDTFDVVVVDTASVLEAGFTFIRRLRAAKNPTPLIALTTGLAADRVRALSLGADDAISQPVDCLDLHARLAAVTRRYKGHSQSLLQVGALTLRLETREVRFADRLIRLTAREYSILELLVLRRDWVVTRDMFLSHLYGGLDEPSVKMIDVLICKLRKKLANAGAGDMLITIWGHGHILRRVGDETPSLSASYPAPALNQPLHAVS